MSLRTVDIYFQTLPPGPGVHMPLGPGVHMPQGVHMPPGLGVHIPLSHGPTLATRHCIQYNARLSYLQCETFKS